MITWMVIICRVQALWCLLIIDSSITLNVASIRQPATFNVYELLF